MDFFDLEENEESDNNVVQTIITSVGGILILFSTILIPLMIPNGMTPFFLKLGFLFTLFSLCYGFYLTMSNKAVLYASKTDVWNQLAIYVVPLLVFGILNFLIDPPNSGFLYWVVQIVGWLSAIASFVYFGLGSGHSNVVLNNPLSTYELMCVNLVKFCLPIFFIFSTAAAANKVKEGYYERDVFKAGAGFIALYLISKIFGWLLPKAFNFYEVMEKR